MANIALGKGELPRSQLRMVVTASSLGTVFEWYDFFVYGTLAPLFASLFFPPGNETAALLLALATFGAGFIVRPFGALFFGALGDIVGRKYTFLVTITLMGLATAGIGLLPTYQDVGITASILLVLLRLIQGLAIGGEYGGAATYVAEHAPSDRRGYFTSYIQATATIGLFLSLAVVTICLVTIPEDDFKAWGWRIPFLISLILLGISIYIRMRLDESPVFAALKAEGKNSRQPIRDSLMKWSNLKYILLAFFGICMGQSVIWYTANFYAMLFMQNSLGVDRLNSYALVAGALLAGMVIVVFCGWLSDRIGRKWIMVSAWLLGALTLQPLFHGLAGAVNPDLMHANEANQVQLIADPASCDIVVFSNPVTACQKARALLSRAGVEFETAEAAAGGQVIINVPYGGEEHALVIDAGFSKDDEKLIRDSLKAAGYPEKADPAKINWPLAVLILTLIVTLGCMAYGPIAAFLVELFPTRIRYTSLSLPYNIANGLVGGFQPLVSFAIVTATGDIFAGLWYPIAIASVAFVVGALFIPETRGRSLHDDREMA